MKKNLKYLVLGIIIGAVAVSATVLADAIWEKIDVVRNHIVVNVDGVKLEADNFLYNDTTYVPIRAVAEALGKNVGFSHGVASIEDKYEAEFGGKELSIADKYTMTEDEYNAYIKYYDAEDAEDKLTAEQLEDKAIKSIIEYNVIKDLANKHGIIIGMEFNENFNNTYAFLKLQYDGEAGVQKALEESGFDLQMYKRYMETNYLTDELLKADGIKGTEEEIKLFYEQNPSMFIYDGIQAQHILIKTTDETGTAITDTAKLADIENRVKNIYKEATKGGNFDQLISLYNEDPGMRENPQGYIFTKGEMVAEFEEAAFALKDGEISAPVKSNYGWHIIKKICDVEKMPLTAELSAQISQELAAIKLSKAITQGVEAVIIQK